MRYMMLVIVLISVLAGCATETQVKSPCDYQGHYCGKKIRINS